MSTKRRRLTLQQKLEILQYASNNKTTIRNLAEKFDIGRTQANTILKDKIGLYQAWALSGNDEMKNKVRKTNTSIINMEVFNWMMKLRNENVKITRMLLKKKALKVAASHGLNDFKASDGWLDRFKMRYNVAFRDKNDLVSLDEENDSSYFIQTHIDSEIDREEDEELFDPSKVEIKVEVDSIHYDDSGEKCEQESLNLIKNEGEEEFVAESKMQINSMVDALNNVRELRNFFLSAEVKNPEIQILTYELERAIKKELTEK